MSSPPLIRSLTAKDPGPVVVTTLSKHLTHSGYECDVLPEMRKSIGSVMRPRCPGVSGSLAISGVTQMHPHGSARMIDKYISRRMHPSNISPPKPRIASVNVSEDASVWEWETNRLLCDPSASLHAGREKPHHKTTRGQTSSPKITISHNSAPREHIAVVCSTPLADMKSHGIQRAHELGENAVRVGNSLGVGERQQELGGGGSRDRSELAGRMRARRSRSLSGRPDATLQTASSFGCSHNTGTVEMTRDRFLPSAPESLPGLGSATVAGRRRGTSSTRDSWLIKARPTAHPRGRPCALARSQDLPAGLTGRPRKTVPVTTMFARRRLAVQPSEMQSHFGDLQRASWPADALLYSYLRGQIRCFYNGGELPVPPAVSGSGLGHVGCAFWPIQGVSRLCADLPDVPLAEASCPLYAAVPGCQELIPTRSVDLPPVSGCSNSEDVHDALSVTTSSVRMISGRSRWPEEVPVASAIFSLLLCARLSDFPNAAQRAKQRPASDPPSPPTPPLPPDAWLNSVLGITFWGEHAMTCDE
ncbi:hypothetical protein K466DRAFT_570002, partial [Polyporus arcularius HHB13444]